MQRKTGFPVANCSIKMPENISMPVPEVACEDESEQQQRRQQLINFGHAQWGFNNWSWTVNKQEVDFVDFANGKYCAGVAAYVTVTVKSLDICRENVGYATSIASNKGFALYKSRKCSVTNALRETLLSFGGSVATELTDLLEVNKSEVRNAPAPAPVPAPAPREPTPENDPNLANKPVEPKNIPQEKIRKESVDSGAVTNPRNPVPVPPVTVSAPAVKNAPPPPVAKAHPMPANLPPAANRPPPANRAPPPPRPGSNDLADMSEEEARAERKRRQRLAQEEFQRKQLLKQKAGQDEKQELGKASTSIDRLMMDIPTQDIVIEESGVPGPDGKRKSPAPEGSCKRRSVVNKLDIVSD